MTDSNHALSQVPALIEERRRYEGWLAALDIRRETTPEHIFDRVRADYVARLSRVDEQIASYRGALVAEQESAQARLATVEADEQLRRDEKAELDLRIAVGELSEQEVDAAVRTIEQALLQLTQERDNLRAHLDTVAALLIVEAQPSSEAAAAVDAQVEQPSTEPEPAHASEDVSLEDAIRLDEPPAVAEMHVPVAEPVATEQPASSFDELAFLSSVVGSDRDTAPVADVQAPQVTSEPVNGDDSLVIDNQEQDAAAALFNSLPQTEGAELFRETDSEKLLAGLFDGQKNPRDGVTPLAAYVPANTPIKLNSSTPVEKEKTLKCTDCGALNYPTEWYCERCGAELAAL